MWLTEEMSRLNGYLDTQQHSFTLGAGNSNVQVVKRNATRWSFTVCLDLANSGQGGSIGLAMRVPTDLGVAATVFGSGVLFERFYSDHPGETQADWFAVGNMLAGTAVLHVFEEFFVPSPDQAP